MKTILRVFLRIPHLFLEQRGVHEDRSAAISTSSREVVYGYHLSLLFLLSSIDHNGDSDCLKIYLIIFQLKAIPNKVDAL